MTFEDLKQTNLYFWFYLEQVGVTRDAAHGQTVVVLKPEGTKFRALVTVNVTVSPNDHILATELILARSFVDHSEALGHYEKQVKDYAQLYCSIRTVSQITTGKKQLPEVSCDDRGS